MPRLATGSDALHTAGDAVALARTVFQSVEAGYQADAARQCERLIEATTELRDQLRREDAVRHSGLALLDFEGELERLRNRPRRYLGDRT